jgi:hypothetical protein
MGCDIHPYVEIKIKGVWHLYRAESKHGRSYLLFGIMAGVRAPEVKLFDPRGLPTDASLVTRLAYDDDAHTPSWLSASELEAVRVRFNELEDENDIIYSMFGHLFGNNIEEWTPGNSAYPLEIEDVRIVFWFDN